VSTGRTIATVGGARGRLSTDLPALAGRLAALGVDAGRPVLVYGAAADGWGEEGRIAWMLRYLGHPEVVLLDGGFPAWQRAGGGVSREAADPEPGQFVANPEPDLRASQEQVATADSTASVVLDTRSRAEWNGSYRYLPKRRGRIPGAVHLHWRDLLAADGTLDRSPAARARLATLGLTDSSTVLAYCVGGVRSAFVTLALRELGIRDVRNYDGSWYEWSANPDRRIASPAAAP
jgi:thiosulfate/3-mercaptopyruvate sulfurtransferase